MIVNILILLGLIAFEVALWFLGAQFEIGLPIVLSAMGGVFLIALTIWLTIQILKMRRAMAIEKKLKEAPKEDEVPEGVSSLAALKEMEKQFNTYLLALQHSPSGKGALASMPWFLVIGAPGSGKTTALQESGMAFSSMGHGVRSIRGIGGTRNCDWWFTDNAIFLDTAGRYTTQPEDQPEWLAFLDMIRETRRGHPLNGIVVMISIGELIKSDAANLAAVVRPIRERIAEVSSRLKVVLPIYVVFSKADLIGGFKDFFAGLDRAERDQVWGTTLSSEDTTGKAPREVYAQHAARLLAPLQIKRMAAITGDRPRAQVTKACLFPGNFVTSQKWFGEFIGELFAPMAITDQPVFRGFYFTSGINVPRPGAAEAHKETVAPGIVPQAQRAEMSFFFSPEQAAPIAEVAENRKGFFLKNFFGRVVIGDGGLAALPTHLVRRAQLVRFVSFYGSLAIALLLVILTIGDFLATRRELAQATLVCKAAVASQHGELKDQLDALEDERALLVEIEARHSASARQLVRHIQEVFFPQLTAVFTDPALAAVADQIETMRKAPGAGQSATDDLFQLWQAYRMLSGKTAPDAHLVEVMLRDQGRWYAGLNTKGSCSPENQRRADKLLAYLVSHLHATGWQGHADDAVIARVQNTLGDSTAILTKYADAEASVQSRIGDLSKDDLVGSDERGLVTLPGGISRIYTHDGYTTVFRAVLTAKSVELQARYHELGSDRSASDVVRELRALYIRRYNQAWLALTAAMRPTPCDNLTDASARLRALTAADSPYHLFAKNLKGAADWHFDDSDAHITLPGDAKWMDDGLNACGDLQHAIDDFLSATQPGNRLADPGKLQTLAGAADKAAAAFDAATGAIEDHTAEDACRACLGSVLTCVRQAAASELLAELDRGWQEKVHRPFTDQLAGRFPFLVSAAQDAPIQPFTALFNPKSGSFWVIVHQVEAMRKVRFGGGDLLTPSSDYLRILTPAKTLTDAFFQDGSEAMNLSLIVTLEPREGLKDISIAMGTQRLKLYDRPDRRAMLAWKQGDPSGAKLSVQIATGQWMTKEQPGPGFGVLRLMRDAVIQDRPAGGTRLTWSFDAPGLKTVNASIVLEAPALEFLIRNQIPPLPEHLSQ